MKRTSWHDAMLAGLALLLSACAANPAIAPSPAVTEVALAATATSVPATATNTATITATPTPADTSTPLATASASPTASATDTATSRPSDTPTTTATASPRPTRPPVTATAVPSATDSLPQAPLWPKSPIVGWSREAFLKSIADSRNNTHDFYDYHGRAVTGATGNCFYFWADYANWEKQPGFTDVPAAWYPLYFQLRTTLQNILVVIQPVVKVCLVGGGHIEDADDQKILAVLAASIDQLDQLGAAAQAMP